MAAARRYLSWLLLTITVGWLYVQAPTATVRELQFFAVALGVTAWTRTVTWRFALAGLALGVGLAAPLTVLTATVLSAGGADLAEGPGSWGIVPVLEEAIKLLPVGLLAGRYRRQSRQTLNPSDWLVTGCAVGAGFALVENAELVNANTQVMRDMAMQYGPNIAGLYAFPGAWGAAGYIGHAGATGIAAGGIGLSMAIRRSGPAPRIGVLSWLRRIPAPWWTAALAGLAWVTAEHMLANLYVDTGAAGARLLGNGRLTPWLGVLWFALVVLIDNAHRREALRRSRIFRIHFALLAGATRGAMAPRVPAVRLLALRWREVRHLNAAAWTTFDGSRS